MKNSATRSADSGRVAVGRVARAHGLGGEVAIDSLTDVEGRFAPGRRLWIEGFEEPQTVEHCRRHHGRLLVRLAGVTDRTAAERLRGLELRVPEAEVPPAPEGCYYHYELVGCSVKDRELGELGEVVRVVEDGGGFLLQIASSDADSEGGLLVPFVEAFLDRVDIAATRIEMDLPPGLIEACGST